MSVLLSLCLTASATTFSVGPNQSLTSITEALALAQDGDAIDVFAGSYNEDLVINRDVTVNGVFGASDTTLVGDVRVIGANTHVRGFTFQATNRAFDVSDASVLNLADSVFNPHQTDLDGGGVHLRGRSLLVVEGCEINDQTSSGAKGGAIAAFQSDVTVRRSTLSGNSAALGGSIYVQDGELLVAGSTLSGGMGDDGGAVYLSGGNATVDQSNFSGNSAGRGGAIYATDGALLTLYGGRLESSVAADHGGAIYLDAATLVAQDAVFDGSQADAGDGGHLYAVSSQIELYNTQMQRGRAQLSGGDLTLVDSELDVVFGVWTDAVVSGADGVGGGIAAFSSSSVTANKLTLSDSSAPAAGGAVYLSNSGGTFTTSTLSNNQADVGGAVFHQGVEGLVLDDSWVIDNSAQRGGGVYWYPQISPSTMVLRAVHLQRNTAVRGGGLYAANGAIAYLIGSDFTDNQASYGAGAYIEGVLKTVATNNIFCANTAVEDGGGLYLGEAGASSLQNNRFVENVTSGDGAGLYLSDGLGARVWHNTFAGNQAGQGGAAHLVGDAVDMVDFANNIVAWSVSGSGLTQAGTGSARVAYNDWYVNDSDHVDANIGPLDASNRFDDPIFSYWTVNRDCSDDKLWPIVSSLSLDAGDPASSDLDGSPADLGYSGGQAADEALWADADNDSVPVMWDCDDADPSVAPGAEEVPYDGVDNDCLAGDLCDRDQDGEDATECGGPDCDDRDAAIGSFADDLPDDGVDQDCDGADATLPATDTDAPAVKGDDKRCGCSSNSSAAAWLWVLLLPLVLRRRC